MLIISIGWGSIWKISAKRLVGCLSVNIPICRGCVWYIGRSPGVLYVCYLWKLCYFNIILISCYNSYTTRPVQEEVFETASDVAYQTIFQRILYGKLQPEIKSFTRNKGETIADHVIPVIEALKRLEEERLVEFKTQWGAFVTVPTVE